jgi:hypothetical protein
MSCCYRVVHCGFRVFFWVSKLFQTTVTVPKVNYNLVHPSKTPWLWIGAKMPDGKIITVTDTVNKYIEYDDVINSSYLEAATKIDTASRWLYLDSKTLNEQEFPPEGLVIKDDSLESGTS